jgi:hypothetical protein
MSKSRIVVAKYTYAFSCNRDLHVFQIIYLWIRNFRLWWLKILGKVVCMAFVK